MLGNRSLIVIALAGACVMAEGPANAASMSGLGTAVSGQTVSDVEQVARRCRYDRHGHLSCRKVRHRHYRRYYYDPYADYGYYPRFYGFGHHHHHGFGRHHHHHGHH